MVMILFKYSCAFFVFSVASAFLWRSFQVIFVTCSLLSIFLIVQPLASLYACSCDSFWLSAGHCMDYLGNVSLRVLPYAHSKFCPKRNHNPRSHRADTSENEADGHAVARVLPISVHDLKPAGSRLSKPRSQKMLSVISPLLSSSL